MIPTAIENRISPARDTRVTARVGIALGATITLCFLTGLISHWIQHPPTWFVWPTHPVWLYRVTQGAHVISGTMTIPLLLVKLWSVYPRLFARPRLGDPLQLLERASIAILVGATIFQLTTGLLNTAKYYPWKFFFTTTHYAMAYVAIGALAVHLAVKLPIVRTALSTPLDDPTPAPAAGAAGAGDMVAAGAGESSGDDAGEPKGVDAAGERDTSAKVERGTGAKVERGAGSEVEGGISPEVGRGTSPEVEMGASAGIDTGTSAGTSRGTDAHIKTVANAAGERDGGAEGETGSGAGELKTVGAGGLKRVGAEGSKGQGTALGAPISAAGSSPESPALAAGPSPESPAPAAPAAGAGVSRRAVLVGAGLGAVVAGLAVAGQTVPYLRWLAVLAPRSGEGPQGLPVNRTAGEAGVGEMALAEGYRLMVSCGGGKRGFSRGELAGLPQYEVELPIACVEGWSASARWAGVRLRDLLGAVGEYRGGDVGFVSLETGGIYGRSVLPRRHAVDDSTLVALRLNGAELSLDHGYPCRLIAPNRPGVLQTKWLSSIEVLS
ncbi:molybdopterin-dependent oxidoreductase [Nocardia sp. NPDC051570]|uniref:molybdopterin-dependent oxidoreductase n=1 Tax=Nocardia sp. NPDC051570 TaxID=3364324 RepID=UPI00378D0682